MQSTSLSVGRGGENMANSARNKGSARLQLEADLENEQHGGRYDVHWNSHSHPNAHVASSSRSQSSGQYLFGGPPLLPVHPHSGRVDISTLASSIGATDPPRRVIPRVQQLSPVFQNCESDDERPAENNFGRNLMRRDQTAFLREVRSAHAEGRPAKHVVETSEEGKILTNRIQWQKAVKSFARTELDPKVRSYKQHPELWEYVVKNIQRELNQVFTFKDTAVDLSYLESYLCATITKDRFKWRKTWRETGTRHPKCPPETYAIWQPHWNSPEGRAESQKMLVKRSKRTIQKGSAIAVDKVVAQNHQSKGITNSGPTSSFVTSSYLLSGRGDQSVAKQGASAQLVGIEDFFDIVGDASNSSLQATQNNSPQYTQIVERRQTLLEEARDEWWKLEVEAMRAEIKDTVDEVKNQTRIIQEILKRLRGVQDSLDQVAAQNAPVVYASESVSLQTLDSGKNQSLSPERVTDRLLYACVPLHPSTTIIPQTQVAMDDVMLSNSRQSTFDNLMCTMRLPDAHQRVEVIVQDNASRTVKGPAITRGGQKVKQPIETNSGHPIPMIGQFNYSTMVNILHPNYVGVVASGKVGSHWKNKTSKLGSLCEPGHQMVQVNHVLVPGVPVLHLEDRHGMKTLDAALSPIPLPSKQKVLYIKWDLEYLMKSPP